VTCAFIARVGQGGQNEFGGSPGQGGGDVEIFGAAQVMQMAGHGVGGPDRKAVREHDRLDVRAEVAVFSRVPSTDAVTLDAADGFGDPVAVEEFAVQDDKRPPPGKRRVVMPRAGRAGGRPGP
jgi:hypothetical protein